MELIIFVHIETSFNYLHFLKLYFGIRPRLFDV